MENRNLFKKIFYYIFTRIIYLRGIWSGYRFKSSNYKDIPIIINNYNRISSLKSLISFLENKGYTNIYIIDNASTYPPLLEYYKTIPYKIFYLDKNTGSRALWKTGIYKQFHNNFFAYTDSDILPVEECPEDFLDHFRNILLRHRYSSKVGFGLKIDDLPSHYRHREAVIEWEKRFWIAKAEEGLYRAPVDTTFALYRPYGSPKANWYIKNLRTGGNYVARHIPWYSDSGNLTDEELFYIKNCRTTTHWTKK
ncbi:MAG: glycosyltransferase family 2 protein [Bacteroidales bacterium]|nr:glycosyltransferase family 2 protein [Bacteroidales bacterium]